MLDENGEAVFDITRVRLASRDCSDIDLFLQAASEKGLMRQMRGRVRFRLKEGEFDDGASIGDLPGLREWVTTLLETVPFIYVLVHPGMSFQLLAHYRITESQDEAAQELSLKAFLLDCGYMAYVLARVETDDVGEAREFTRAYLESLELVDVNDDLMTALYTDFEESFLAAEKALESN